MDCQTEGKEIKMTRRYIPVRDMAGKVVTDPSGKSIEVKDVEASVTKRNGKTQHTFTVIGTQETEEGPLHYSRVADLGEHWQRG